MDVPARARALSRCPEELRIRLWRRRRPGDPVTRRTWSGYEQMYLNRSDSTVDQT